MSQKEKWKWVYKVVRSILFTSVAFVAFLYVALYILLSVPAVQDVIRKRAEAELSSLITSSLTIDNVSIYPFNEVVVEGVALKEPDGYTDCALIERLGAGISLWKLITRQEIVVTYVELLGLDARVRQDSKDGPLNIQFLIDAFKPKDKNKPPTKFDLQIRNIVIRKSKVSFTRPWLEEGENFPNVRRLAIGRLNADLTIPRLSNDVMIFDLRRLEFEAEKMLKVDGISGKAILDHGNLSIEDFNLATPGTEIIVGDFSLPLNYPGGLKKWLTTEKLGILLDIPKITPMEFSFLWRPLEYFTIPLAFKLNLDGNLNGVDIRQFYLETPESNRNSDGHFSLALSGYANLGAAENKSSLTNAQLDKFELRSTPAFNSMLTRVLRSGSANADGKAAKIISQLGNIDLSAEAGFSRSEASGNIEANADIALSSGVGDLKFNGEWLSVSGLDKMVINLNSSGIDFGKLLATELLGQAEIDLKADCSVDNSIFKPLKGKSVDQILAMVKMADVELDMPHAEIKRYNMRDLRLNLSKTADKIVGTVNCDDDNFNISLDAEALIAGIHSRYDIIGKISNLRPSVINGIMEEVEAGTGIDRKNDLEISGDIDIRLAGNNLDNLQGDIELSSISLNDYRKGRQLNLDNLLISSNIHAEENDVSRSYTIVSDWIEGGITGHFLPTRVPGMIHALAADAFPDLIPRPEKSVFSRCDDDFTFDFTLKRNGSWSEFFNLPVTLLYEAGIEGRFDGEERIFQLNVNAPYIQQGRDKLITGTRASVTLHSGSANLNFGVVYPTKKGDLEVIGDIASVNGDFLVSLDFNPDRTTSFYGKLDMEASVRNAGLHGKEVALRILPGELHLNHAAWSVAQADLTYIPSAAGPKAEIKGFSVSHDNQFVKVSGVASSSPDDNVTAILNEVDLDYIFDTLNINYVKFGGCATGEAAGSALFSKNIVAETKRLHVKDLSYNGAVLGDGELHGDFDINRKRIGIRADISEAGRPAAVVDGGIWLGRDSLSFGIEAQKVRIGFLAPFMEAFASKVDGRASGNALLYGTFSDVDMKGRLFADTIALGVAYTNVTYCGSDSVIISPGRIDIPSFTLRDLNGHTAILQGELTHRYFHDPEFDFRVTDARNLLLYDTNPKMNPVWYGRIFGTGSGRILGRGNYVGISADMTTEANSSFTFVLSDQEDAAEYNFLSFTDKRKEKEEAEKPVEISETDAIVEAFKKRVLAQQGPGSVFGMDIRATITPSIQLTLVMDPVAGDKILARGSGTMNMQYRSDTDDLRMYGKYVLDEGVYNFSLQDVILKDFIIKEGSSISFNGDPMAGILDIRAAYRVNTNLADLDQSFALDRDLNRTQVPVDAMLIVRGDMDSPDISFDIELPTLNDEVEQKVRSVISSEDMMNLQMIYLLALNRFYTPEYMGGSSGGEWASVATSTISSQLSSILGQLTDKFSVAPSIRSDKGDFSDLEVDVALSSRLFNNRLLINGNLGYRDPATSSTTFIGDFDVEYLLNRAGNWRLKAYNHFNDQNYYLKSALTTQGVGIMWRRDFDHIFGLKKRKKESSAENDSEPPTHDEGNKGK